MTVRNVSGLDLIEGNYFARKYRLIDGIDADVARQVMFSPEMELVAVFDWSKNSSYLAAIVRSRSQFQVIEQRLGQEVTPLLRTARVRWCMVPRADPLLHSSWPKIVEDLKFVRPSGSDELVNQLAA
jgi:hypothetical protein